jgi:phosphoribosylanthranilate isomerase
MTKIKICGITNPDIAYEAACAGADFIGLVFVPSSKRAVTVQIAQAIAHAAREGGAEPVAVFTEAGAKSMQEICEKTDIHYVQLHGNQSREEQHLLPPSFHRIYIQPVSSKGIFDLDESIKMLDKRRDYLLFDGMHPGSGKTFDWSHFAYLGDFPWFLSGGLNATNVKEAIETLHPTAVDVSSGVENRAGEKTSKLIEQFIKAI